MIHAYSRVSASTSVLTTTQSRERAVATIRPLAGEKSLAVAITGDDVRKLIAYLLIFFGILLAGGIVGWLVRKLLKAAMLSWADRLAGAAAGLVVAMLAAALIAAGDGDVVAVPASGVTGSSSAIAACDTANEIDKIINLINIFMIIIKVLSSFISRVSD